jgi:putative transposase
LTREKKRLYPPKKGRRCIAMKELNFDYGKNLLLRWIGVKNFLPKEIFWEDIRSKVKQMVKRVLEYSLEKELEGIIRAGRYEHTSLREGYRNGYRRRSLITHLCGRIDNLLVPRARERVKFKLLKRYQRRVDEFDYAVLSCFLNGQSTRKIAQFFYNFFGEINLSHQTVTNIIKTLDGLARQFIRKSLRDEYMFLIVDAKYIRVSPISKRKRPVIFCIGIREDLSYEILYFKVVTSENEINYTNFFFDLREKGLEGNNLKMLICDGKRSIENAFLFIYPNKDIQICSVHYVREALKYVRDRKHLSELKRKANALYKAKTYQEFLNRLNALKKEYQGKEPKFIKILVKDIDKTVSFYKYSQRYHSLIKSTNLLERFLRDIEELTRYWAGFRDVNSANRVIYLLVERFNKRAGGYSLLKFTHFF